MKFLLISLALTCLLLLTCTQVRAGPCEDLQKDSVLDTIFVNPADSTFNACLDNVKRNIESGLDNLKDIYNSLTREMDSIRKQNQDLKSDLVDGLNQLGKERDEETKLIILSLKKRILEADKDCEVDKLSLIVKADEHVRYLLEKKINDLKKKVEQLQKEKEDLNKLIEEFKALEKQCQIDLSANSEKYNKDIQEISTQIQKAIDNLAVQVAEQRRIDQQISSSCLSTLQTFMDKAEAPFKVEAPSFDLDFARFNKFYPIDAKPLQLSAYYRLYLIGKIINVEIFYKELIPELEQKKLKADQLLKEVNSQTEKARQRAGDVAVYERLVIAYQDMISNYKISLEKISTNIRDISSNLNSIEDTSKILNDQTINLRKDSITADAAQKLACKNAQEKLNELLAKIKSLQDQLKLKLEDLKEQQAQTNNKIQISKELETTINSQFEPALEKIADRMRNINYSNDASFEEEHHKIVTDSNLKKALEIVDRSLKTCHSSLLDEDKKEFRDKLSTKFSYIKHWLNSITGENVQ